MAAPKINKPDESQSTEVPIVPLTSDTLSHYPSEHEDEGEGGWLVSYADMMTLLVGFFVVLQSFSKPDAGAFEKMKKETTMLFGGEYVKPFEKISNDLQKVVKDMGVSDQVLFVETEQGIEVTFRGALFFDAGAYTLRDEATNLMARLIPIIAERAKNFGIVVEGHTDSTPLNARGPMASNWELSSIRACAILRLFEARGFSPKRMRALGLGDTHPLVPEKNKAGIISPEAQAQNRRVVIRILKNLSEQI